MSAIRSIPPAASSAPIQLVIKLGGRVQQDPALAPALAALCRAHPGGVCIVHGGGDEISTLQRAMGVEPTFVGGRRVTRAEDLDFVRMALSGASNKRLVSALGAAGVSAVGISGEDAGLFLAERGEPALGCVGRVTSVQPALLHLLLGAGHLPVVSPLAREAATGGALNVNGDDAAAALAAALGAEEVLFLADVPGVLADGAVIDALDPVGARALVANGTAAGGMAAKLDAALAALDAGVPGARIGGLDALRDAARGTRITLSVPSTPARARGAA